MKQSPTMTPQALDCGASCTALEAARPPKKRRRNRRSPGPLALNLLALILPFISRAVINNDATSLTERSRILALVPTAQATHVATSSGDWSNAATWNAGVPTVGANVHIPSGLTVTFNAASTPALAWVRVDGAFTFRTDVTTQLKVDTLVIDTTGALTIGTAANPIASNVTARVTFPAPGPINFTADPFAFSRGLISAGTVTVHGAVKTPYVPIVGTLLTGASNIPLASPVPSDWTLGDEIVIPGTSFDPTTTGSPDRSLTNPNFSKDDERTILSISGSNVGVTPLTYAHSFPAGYGLNIWAVNFTRNVIFETENGSAVPFPQRAHAQFLHNDAVSIKYAAFNFLGRTDKAALKPNGTVQTVTDPTGTGTGLENPRGRYSLHIHRMASYDEAAGLYGPAATSPPIDITGCAVWQSPGWGYVNHLSHVNFTDNVSFDVDGAHYATEVGCEIGRFTGNFCIKSRGCGTDDRPDLLQFHTEPRAVARDTGVEGLGFWFETTYGLHFDHNIVSGARFAGAILWGHSDEVAGSMAARPIIATANLPANLQSIAGNRTIMKSWMVPLYSCTGNVVFNSGSGWHLLGHLRDDDAMDGRDVKHTTPTIFANFKFWNIIETGIFVNYASRAIFRDGMILGDVVTPIPADIAAQTDNTGVGLATAKNPRFIVYDNLRVEGFTIGVSVGQTIGQGLADIDEFPLGQMRISGGTFANNTFHFYPSNGRNGNGANSGYLSNRPPFSPWAELLADPTTEIPPTDVPPTADFTFTSPGGKAMRFDASGSFDPEYDVLWVTTNQNPGVVPSYNDLVAYRWDFGDGSPIAHGRYVGHYYAAPGTYAVTLTVWDVQGQADTQTHPVTVTGTAPQVNLVRETSFAATGLLEPDYTGTASLFHEAGSGINPRDNDRWSSSTGWTRNTTLRRAELANTTTGKRHLTLIIHDRHVTRGLQPLRFKAWNTEGDPTLNFLQFRAWGCTGNNWSIGGSTNGPVNNSLTEPLLKTLLWDSGNIANGTPLSGVLKQPPTQSGRVDLGAGGHEYLVLQFIADKANVAAGDYIAVDDVKLGVGNIAPLVSAPGSQTTTVNVPAGPIAFTVEDDETAPAALVITAQSDNPVLAPAANLALGGSAENRTLTLTPAADRLGTSNITLTVSDGEMSNQVTVPFTVTGTPLQTWRHQYFATTADAGSAATLADPNNDGINNLLSYALGLNPTGPSVAPGLPATSIPANRLALAFTRLRDATDIIYRVLASDDLSAWTPIWSSATNLYPSAQPSILQTVQDTEVIGAATPHRFLRLEITAP